MLPELSGACDALTQLGPYTGGKFVVIKINGKKKVKRWSLEDFFFYPFTKCCQSKGYIDFFLTGILIEKWYKDSYESLSCDRKHTINNR